MVIYGMAKNEISERSALNRAREQVQQAYNSREEAVRNKAVELAGYLASIANSESNYYFPKVAKNTAEEAMIKCSETFKSIGVILSPLLIKGFDIQIPVKSFDYRSILQELQENVVYYHDPYALNNYVSTYCDVERQYDHEGLFGRAVYKYSCDYREAIQVMEKDINDLYSINHTSVWSRLTSGFYDFEKRLASELDSRLDSMIKEAKRQAQSSGSEASGELNKLKAMLDPINKYI